jgi:hypothetical protein
MAPRPDRLSSIQIAELFAVADGIRKDTSESERREAIDQLLAEFRSQYEQAAREIEDHEKARAAVIGEAEAAGMSAVQFTAKFHALGPGPVIDPLLMQGVKAWAFRIFLQPNPISALGRFLGTRHRRGKRAKNTERDFWISVAVVKKRKSGMTLDDASYAVAESCGLEGDSVKKIYNRNHLKAKAHVAMVAMDNSPEKGS